MRIGGVYAICNQATSEAYIGVSWFIAGRWKRHRYLLAAGCHPNHALQRAFHKGGEQLFGLVILERFEEGRSGILPRREWLSTEKLWMDRARAAGISLYNDQVGHRRRKVA